MARWSRRDRALALSCTVASIGVAAVHAPARAEPNAPRRTPHVAAAPASSAGGGAASDASAEAQRHFQKARDLYKAGSYREAIVELEAAVKLDPTGKELVYNLGVLHEKLGDIDDALKYFRQYATMDLTSEEREKTEASIRRLEGAKKEVEDKKRANQLPPPPPPTPAPVRNGRVDALTVGAASLSAAALVFGVVFGLKATSNRPPASGFVTGRDGSYADLQDRADTAHKQAVLSDVGFAVGGLAVVGTVLLYALRPKESPRSLNAPTTGRTTTVSAAPLPGGGALTLGGSF